MPEPKHSATARPARDEEVRVRIELGRALMSREEAAQLGPGCFVLLDTLTADLVDIYAGGQLIAQGEVVVIDDRFCVRVIQIAMPRARAAAA